ncbi:hypothetical protein PTTG_25330 [Puccinia triticina 1-1 BBBD Race 1]|uniref:DDE Tnp4 domain-containing protein n=1 Tax=Puccinia triticina (isolate 1-1 / race 1 (BBBD)) TaxID=630390 RepID=A0A180H2P5_PUCT1|nr:hypothetical protein PTTG_25330 [Puccinia triticina 1-1 BBBD Race 1]
MPRQTERKSLIRDLQFLLITCFARLQISDQNYRTIITGQRFPLFCIIIVALLEKVEAPDQDILLSLAVILLLRSRSRSRYQLLRFQHRLWEARTTHAQAEGILQLITTVCNRRYLAPRAPRPRISTISRTFEVFSNNTDAVFLRWARMTQDSFYALLNKIKDHPVFMNDSNHHQAPTEWQLLVALAHLGINGNGGSPHILREVFNISEGSIENYTNRCLRAIADLEEKYVRWPSAADQAAYCTETIHDFFDDAVGLIDGTIFPLAFAPTVHKEDFWMRKSIYGMNSMIVCTREQRIIYALHGWCGSAHDQRVYKNSQVCYPREGSVFSIT